MTIEIILFLLIYDKEMVLFINKLYDFNMKNHIIQIVKKIFYIKKEA